MVTVFYGLITLMFRVNPPPMFLRVKFGKKSGGNTRVNTVILRRGNTWQSTVETGTSAAADRAGGDDSSTLQSKVGTVSSISPVS
jgi:hypothetical protein